MMHRGGGEYFTIPSLLSNLCFPCRLPPVASTSCVGGSRQGGKGNPTLPLLIVGGDRLCRAFISFFICIGLFSSRSDRRLDKSSRCCNAAVLAQRSYRKRKRHTELSSDAADAVQL